MKFAVFAVVVLALVAVAHSSVIPLLAVSGPGGAIAAPGSIAIQATLANGPVSLIGIPAISQIATAPVAIATAPAAAVAAPAGEAVAIAKTRGVVHIAPLPGHTQSVTSLNLQPAPGTH